MVFLALFLVGLEVFPLYFFSDNAEPPIRQNEPGFCSIYFDTCLFKEIPIFLHHLPKIGQQLPFFSNEPKEDKLKWNLSLLKFALI